jgi:prevent-host-death family protein
VGFVRRIPHRELRNNSSAILDAVKHGEIIEVTNGGEVAAILIPPSTAKWDILVAGGKVSDADDVSGLDDIPRVASPTTVAALLDDLRGER